MRTTGRGTGLHISIRYSLHLPPNLPIAAGKAVLVNADR